MPDAEAKKAKSLSDAETRTSESSLQVVLQFD
jgi:hypothetical protein